VTPTTYAAKVRGVREVRTPTVGGTAMLKAAVG